MVVWTESRKSTASRVLKLSVVTDDSNHKGQRNTTIFFSLSRYTLKSVGNYFLNSIKRVYIGFCFYTKFSFAFYLKK